MKTEKPLPDLRAIAGTEETSRPSDQRIDVSRAAVSRSIGRLPPGEHLVEIRAKAIPERKMLRVVAFSAELGAGMAKDLDRILGPKPPEADKKATQAYVMQGQFWLSMLEACGISEDELRDVTLAELAEKFNSKRVIAAISDGGFWNRVRGI